MRLCVFSSCFIANTLWNGTRGSVLKLPVCFEYGLISDHPRALPFYTMPCGILRHSYPFCPYFFCFWCVVSVQGMDVLHGDESAGNTGFLMFYNPRLQARSDEMIDVVSSI